MAAVEHTSDARVLVGIDISKHRHEVLIAVPGKTRRRRQTITNSTDAFMRLIAILREFGLPVRIGFEATGYYQRLFRIYREERLHVRHRGGRKWAIGTLAPMTLPLMPNQRWSLDFV